MRAQDLKLDELLDASAEGGRLQFAGQRALLLDAVALGLLRKQLIDTVGQSVARGLLTRFGYAHGWRTAESLREAFDWSDERAWHRAGGRLHTLQGLVTVVPVAHNPASGPEPFAHAVWQDSYEAEQHVLHLGRAEEAVCWTLCGFASGYLSCCNGQDIYCIEERCQGKGDASCRVVGKPKEEWGTQIEPHLPFYAQGCLDAEIERLTGALKDTEKRLRSRRQELRRVGAEEDDGGLIAHSEGMRRVLTLARRAARVDSTVLLLGESGTGKERAARLIHGESPRAAGPFVAVNCAALTESLLESELFGHAKGAFTGATQDRPGLFEAASGGTLFLDELGDISPSLQVKLLRVLQEREVRRVGETHSRKVDVRVVAATHRELREEVARGRFRQDLYYRLRVLEIRLPPLRERPEDILPLARVMLADAARRLGRRVTGLGPKAADLLLRHSWPGNVRELEHALERAVALTDERRIRPEDLPEEVRGLASTRAPGESRRLAEVERTHILGTLERHGGNRAATARELGIGTATLYRKLREYRA